MQIEMILLNFTIKDLCSPCKLLKYSQNTGASICMSMVLKLNKGAKFFMMSLDHICKNIAYIYIYMTPSSLISLAFFMIHHNNGTI